MTKPWCYDKKTQMLRPILPGDIAILSRTWQPLEVYGEALESVGIPVALGGGGNLLATREAKDGWALLRFLADPSDDLALVAVLRSPFFAVSDRVLFTFIQSQEENETTELDEQSKTNWWQKLKSSDIPELQRPLQVLGQLLRDRNLEPPTRLLQIANYLTGYTIATKISSYFPQVAELYYRLIIVPCDRTQKINFQKIANCSNNKYINVNLELSRDLLELTQRQRSLKAEELLRKIIGNPDNRVIFLEHLEILFDTSLKLDPLRCLLKLARDRIIVARWDGIVENNNLIYAEYRLADIPQDLRKEMGRS